MPGAGERSGRELRARRAAGSHDDSWGLLTSPTVGSPTTPTVPGACRPVQPAGDIIDRHARHGRSMANALTTARVLLALPFAFLMMQSDGRSAWLAALVLAVAIATDALDGPVARRRGTISATGRVFDHGADCFFVTSGPAARAP